jgi:hypothetical protein
MRNRAAVLLVGGVALLAGCKGNESAPTTPSASAQPAALSSAVPSSTAPASSTGTAAGAAIARGDRAPDFRLEGSDGKTHALADHVGKQAVVVAWFPKAFTSG